MSDEEQSKELTKAAERLAQYVKETGRKVRVLGADPPARKVMHMALNDRPSVDNVSHGYGIFRHLIVGPASAAPEEAPAEEVDTEPGVSEQEDA